ncbi:MAG: hypothetical protein V1685_06650 [Parcubacteria group bacterium]
MKDRPSKKSFSREATENLRNRAIEKIKSKFFPFSKIIRIVLIGSSLKGDFGQYDSPGFRGSAFSDFDFIFYVKDDYQIPSWLGREPSGKPFSNDTLNLAYRCKNFIDGTYDIEVLFIREKSMYNNKILEEGELAGIPMSKKSKNIHLVIYQTSEHS